MVLQTDILNAITIVIVVAIIVIGLVAILAPASLSAFVRPLLATIDKLVDALRSKDPPKE